MASPLLMQKVTIRAPLPADLVSIHGAATPVNGALSIAAQPVHARKLQIDVVVGTSTTTAITAGVIAIDGIDQDGFTVDETISVVANATLSPVLKSKYAYAKVNSLTLSGYAASGSGTGNTIGVGVSNDFGVPTSTNVQDLTLIKATKIITSWNAGGPTLTFAATDDVAANATVDAVARTIAPTTAPAALGINDYEFTYGFDTPWLYD